MIRKEIIDLSKLPSIGAVTRTMMASQGKSEFTDVSETKERYNGSNDRRKLTWIQGGSLLKKEKRRRAAGQIDQDGNPIHNITIPETVSE